jgi:MoaA/NifB/PqqE/SkfB family radical SAM enzyme
MSPETYRTFVDEITSYDPIRRAKSMIFSASGEPTANPAIVELIKYTRKRNLDLSLVTNGWGWVNRDRRPGLVDAVLENVYWTRTSLNAGTAETRRKIHGVNDFEKVLDGLAYLAERKKETGSRTQIGAQIVVTEDNIDEISLACLKVKATGIDYMQIKPVTHNTPDPTAQLSADFMENAVLLSEAAENLHEGDGFKVITKRDQFEVMARPDLGIGSFDRCRGTFFPIIEADGSVYHCSQTRGKLAFKFGNINDSTFEEIWGSDERVAVIEAIDVRRCQPVCRNFFTNADFEVKVKGGNAPNFT